MEGVEDQGAEVDSWRGLRVAPMGEPAAWCGPIVMNIQEEMQIGFEEYQNGSFIKHQRS
jgi:hypothetical protein